MIREIYSLVHEDTNEILGVRIETVDNRKFDLDLASFHSIVKMDVSNFEPIELFYHDGLLVSHEEFYGGVVIEDASRNTKVLNAIKSFFANRQPEKVLDPEALQKREETKFKLRREYYTYLPNDMLEDFAEYHIQFFDGNRGIYDSLSDTKEKEIHTYSRWRSRSLFEERSKYNLLKAKPDKADKLLELMGDADDWVYDGVIDLGYHRAGECSLRHKLRYQHFAYSPSTGRTVAFGQQCIADFFEVPPSVLREITNAQEVILKEIKVIVYLLNTGRVEEYYKKSDIDPSIVQELIDSRVEEGNRKNTEWLIRMASFLREGIPLSRGMVKKLKQLEPSLQQVREAKQKESRIQEVLDDLKDSSFPKEDLKNLLTSPPNDVFEMLTKKLLLVKEYDHPLVEAYFKYYHDTVQGVKTHLEQVSNSSLKDLIKCSELTFFFVKDVERKVLRLSSYEDKVGVKDLISGSVLRKETHQCLDSLATLFYPKRGINQNSLTNSFEITKYEYKYADELVKAVEVLNKVKLSLYTSEFLKEIKFIKDRFPKVETVSQSLEYITFPLTKQSSDFQSNRGSSRSAGTQWDGNGNPRNSKLDEDTNPTMYNIISELEAVRNTPVVRVNPFVYDIIETVHRTGRISEKQEYYIRKGFNQVIENIEKYAEKGVLKKDDKVLAIIETFRTYGRLSDKQLAYISKANRIILDHLIEKEVTESDNAFPF